VVHHLRCDRGSFDDTPVGCQVALKNRQPTIGAVRAIEGANDRPRATHRADVPRNGIPGDGWQFPVNEAVLQKLAHHCGNSAGLIQILHMVRS